jgi:hypothetical protein
MLAAIMLGLVGAFALLLTILPGSAPCTGVACYNNRGLFGWIGITFVVVAGLSIWVVARDRNTRGGVEDAAASVGLGTATAIAVGFLGPIWASPITAVYALPVALIVLLVVFVVVQWARRSTLAPQWWWVLTAYGIVRLILLPVAPLVTGSAQHVTEDIFWWWLSLGIAPLAAGVVLGMLGRLSRNA